MRQSYTKLVFFYLLIFICCSNLLFSQAAAVPASGCAPLGVSFTGVPGSTNISWTFEAGATSNLINPSHTFSTPGTYTVTYTATVSGSPVNQTVVIHVFGKPTPSFSATTPRKGCAPLPLTFHDNSTGGGGTSITHWQWTFGDGGFDTVHANPTYVYTLQGQFNVSLIVTDANGCDSSLTLSNYITVSTKPVIVFNTTALSACLPPLIVDFTNVTATSGSPIGPALTYSWSFGNGNTSTVLPPPSQHYNSLGTYPIKFIVTDNNSCSDTVNQNVVIQNPHASFVTADTICKSATFVSNSTGGNIFQWQFGDGQTGSGSTVSHNYAASGHYNVTLTVLNINGTSLCQDDSIIPVYVEDPVVNFTIAPTYMCSLPTAVNLNNTSTGGGTYQWSFSETTSHYDLSATSSTVHNPTFNIINLDTNRYTINVQDILVNVSLVVTSSHGCKDSLRKTLVDTIYLPTARYMPDKFEGCAPLTVQFSDSSHSKETIVSWNYIFGDGATINQQNPTHTYTQPGIYYPKLVIVNSRGCIDTSYIIPIKVGTPPHPDFSISPSTVCIGQPVTFTDLTPATDSVDTWHYSTDGGIFMSHCWGDANPTWSFVNATGQQDITLKACERGCCDSITKTNAITVNGPLSKMSVKMDCDSSHVYQFFGNQSDATTWDWDFGDGTVIPGSTTPNMSHTYPATANGTDYIAVLTSYNASSGCAPFKDTIVIHVRDIKARFVTDTLICSGASINYNATTSHDVYPYNNNGYVWLWGDGSHPDILDIPTVSHSYSPGIHTITLIVKDINGCHDTARFQNHAYDVYPSFTTNHITLCKTDSVSITNLTSVSTDTTITSTGWLWDFGDGSPTSSLQNPPSHVYSALAGNNVSISLTATNVLGCSRTVTKTLTVSLPDATFTATGVTHICAGQAVQFNLPINYPTITWNFGDGSPVVNNTQTPSHTYNTSGTFPTTVSVIDSIGCTDTKVVSGVIDVQNKPTVYITSPAFTASSICYPYQGQFTDSSVVNVFDHHIWNLGTGQPVNNSLQTVGTTYPTPGTYTITLVVVTTYGCTDSLQKSIVVNGPIADFTLSPQTICKGQSITFTMINPVGVASYQWDFGDGQIDSTNTSPITHQYNFHPPGGTTNAQLIYWSANKSCPQTKSYPINIQQVIADFNRNNELPGTIAGFDTAHCIGLTDQFLNTSVNGDTYTWNFGDGSPTISSNNNPSHTYTAIDTFTVSINIKNNATGCMDTIKKEMIIYNNPIAIAHADTACKDSTIHLTASGAGAGGTYLWSPATGLSCTTCQNPTAQLLSTGMYAVTVIDVHGCTADTTTSAVVVQPPAHIDTTYTIVIGQSVDLPYPGSAGLNYSWNPTTALTCSTCPVPTANPLTDTDYTVTVTDAKGCYNEKSFYDVIVLPLSSIDVPTAFTPNGDGVNDIVYVAGWGIKKLNYFRIYNRWGELVFECNDITVGWDGNFKGVPQNMETYVYQAEAEAYIESKPVVKKGYIKLIR